jgi:hypothetical protein
LLVIVKVHFCGCLWAVRSTHPDNGMWLPYLTCALVQAWLAVVSASRGRLNNCFRVVLQRSGTRSCRSVSPDGCVCRAEPEPQSGQWLLLSSPILANL